MDTLEHLRTFGYAIRENVLSDEQCKRAVTALEETEAELRSAGRTDFMSDEGVTICMVHQRRPDVFIDLLDLPEVMDVVEPMLQEPVILHDVTGARSGPRGGQRLHIDSRLPIRDPDHTTQMQALLCFNDFTHGNGATRVSPGSHRSGVNPRGLRDEKIPMVTCEASRGSVVFFLAQTWHDGGPNLDGSSRWSLNIFYARWWLKPNYDFTQCGAETFRRLTPRQKCLFGFNSRPAASRAERQYIMVDIKDVPSDYAHAISQQATEAY